LSGDVLSDLLRAVRLRGAVFFYLEAADPWVAEAPPIREIIHAIMPGADAMIAFHCIARGSCWAAIVGEKPVRLDEGDVILFPQGDAQVISSTPGLRGKPEDRAIYFAPRPPQLPFSISIGGQGGTTARLDGGGPEHTKIVCGFLACDARPFNPLLAALPRLLRMPGLTSGRETWIGHLLDTAVDESNHRRPGGEAVLERMSEMIFVEVLRRYLDGLPTGETGWLAGMRDAGVGRALSLMHERPAQDWTLERLGEECGLSRSVLHERFVQFLSLPPMQYLGQWRMQLAASRLRDSDAKVIEIALDVGYESEAAFSRAFKRMVGVTPGEWRRAHLAPSGRRPDPEPRPARVTEGRKAGREFDD